MKFAIRIVNLYKFLNENKKIYSLANQVLRSGTAIGALMIILMTTNTTH